MSSLLVYTETLMNDIDVIVMALQVYINRVIET